MAQGTLLVGEIYNAFTRVSAVAIRPVRPVCKGCTLFVEGFGYQVASSLEINRQSVEEVASGTPFGLLINNPEFTVGNVRKALLTKKFRAISTGQPIIGIRVFLLTPAEEIRTEEAKPGSANDNAGPLNEHDIWQEGAVLLSPDGLTAHPGV